MIEPADGLRPIYDLLSSARRSVDMTMYELADPRVVAILEADAARGVVVRVLLDSADAGRSVNAGDAAQLAAHGVKIRWAPTGTIFHQKTITVDDTTSAIMTLNLTSQYYATTRDFAVLTTDAADVAAIEQVFASDWTGSGPPQAGPSGDGLVWSPGALGPLLDLISDAHRSLLVENEEMDDSAVVDALAAAARRGVDVEVVMTASAAWDAAFEQLVGAGVHVHTYGETATIYIHAKVIVADGTTAFVGSQNFSVASLEYNRELGLITTDRALVTELARTVVADFSGATPFSGAEQPSAAGGVAGTAWCRASAAPANDGYAGDYDVSVSSNQPDTRATATDAGDSYGEETGGSGSAVIDLWHTKPGESISVTVGAAACSTTAS